MRKKMFALALCLILALALMPAAVSATVSVTNKTLHASIGQNVRFSCDLAASGAIKNADLSALRALGLNGSVDGKRLTVSGTAEKAGQVRMQISDLVLSVRVSGPELPPKTGDENMPLLFAGLALCGLAGFVFMMKRARS